MESSTIKAEREKTTRGRTQEQKNNAYIGLQGVEHLDQL